MKRSVYTVTALTMALVLAFTGCVRNTKSSRDRDSDDDEDDLDKIDEFMVLCEEDLDCETVRSSRYARIISGQEDGSDIDNGMVARLDEDTCMEIIFANGDPNSNRPIPDEFEEAGAYSKITDDGYGMMTATLIEFADEDDALDFLETATDFYSERNEQDAFAVTYAEDDDLVVSTSMPYGATYSEIAFFADGSYVLMIANAYNSDTFYEFEETDEIADFFGFDAPSSYHQ